MNKITTALTLSIPIVLASCSRLPGFSECNEAVDQGLIQEVFEKNIRSIEPRHPFEIGFCLQDHKNAYCDIKTEVSDIKEESKTAYSSSCTASLRYSATLRDEDYQKERQRRIDKANAKAASDLANSRQFVVDTFAKFEVSYSPADLQEGVSNREAAIHAEQQTALDDIDRKSMPATPQKKSHFMVVNAAYTVSKSKDFLNVNLDNLELVANGE